MTISKRLHDDIFFHCHGRSGDLCRLRSVRAGITDGMIGDSRLKARRESEYECGDKDVVQGFDQAVVLLAIRMYLILRS
jgi:hypothetical protein